MNTSSVVLVGGALAAFVLGGCSGDDGEAVASTAAPVTTVAASTETFVPPGPSMIVDVETAPGSVVGAESGDDDTEVASCTGLDGRWQATGTVTNPTDAAADYRVYVTFVEGNRIVALVEATVDGVAAGATQEWTAGFEGTMPGLTCITRVERDAA